MTAVLNGTAPAADINPGEDFMALAASIAGTPDETIVAKLIRRLRPSHESTDAPAPAPEPTLENWRIVRGPGDGIFITCLEEFAPEDIKGYDVFERHWVRRGEDGGTVNIFGPFETERQAAATIRWFGRIAGTDESYDRHIVNHRLSLSIVPLEPWVRTITNFKQWIDFRFDPETRILFGVRGNDESRMPRPIGVLPADLEVIHLVTPGTNWLPDGWYVGPKEAVTRVRRIVFAADIAECGWEHWTGAVPVAERLGVGYVSDKHGDGAEIRFGVTAAGVTIE